MKNYIKNSARVLYDYAMALIIFVIFIYIFMSITKEQFNKWLPLYSFLLFLFGFYIIFTDLKAQAKKELKPQYEMHPYPLKGLVYGLIAIIPVGLLTGVAAMIHLSAPAEHIKHLAINIILGPLYFIIRWFHESIAGYAAAILMLPLMAMLGYLAGYYGIEVFGKLRKKKEVQEKGFRKSPWNPTNVSARASGKKKKK